jgi:CubicO group peptidase (beta-lactamase class C family)
MSFLRFTIALFLLYLPVCGLAQSFDKPHLDSFFQVLSTSGRAMGTLAISKNGKEVYQQSIGAARIDGKQEVPATSKTRYRIGSITKMFTAAMVFGAIEEQKLSLSTPLAKYFPSVPGAAGITIGHLLSHRSGLHNFTDDSLYNTYRTKPKSRKELLAIIAAGGTDFPADSTARYSNSNYVLLGFMLEDIYKKPYSNILQEKICRKAGLAETTWGANPPAAYEAKSYSWEGKWTEEPITDMSIPGGAGAIVSTTADLNKFIYTLFTGRLVSSKSLEQMMTMRDRYGMGLFVFPLGSRKFYGHTGGIDGFQSMLVFNPADSVAVAYCTNGVRYSRNDILLAALGSYYGTPMPLPVFSNQTYQPQNLPQYTGVYASLQLPMKITIAMQGGILTAQATGQSAFPLTPVAKDEFTFEAAGVVITFKPEAYEFTLKQSGGAYLFTKEK